MGETREGLVDAVSELAHGRGFHRTTIAEIAAAAQIPTGNVYYHFKTKESLGRALLERRHQQCAALLGKLEDATDDPRERLVAFARATREERDDLAVRGCPVGTLAMELRRSDDPLAGEVRELIAHWLGWLAEQFHRIGTADEPLALAGRLLGELQGAALLALALGDPEQVDLAVSHCENWIWAL